MMQTEDPAEAAVQRAIGLERRAIAAHAEAAKLHGRAADLAEAQAATTPNPARREQLLRLSREWRERQQDSQDRADEALQRLEHEHETPDTIHVLDEQGER